MLGSDAYITLIADESIETIITSHFERIWKLIDQFEASFSRFIPGSELSKFNTRAGEKVTISKEFSSILKAAKSAALESRQLFNPFILPALQRAGYVGSWIDKDLKPIDYTKRSVVDISGLEINDDWARIPKNSALDLGGIGKGYLLDLLAPTLISYKLTGFWISLGGDIICFGQDLDRKWRIGIADASDPSNIIAYAVNDTNGLMAVATSGVTKRKGMKDSKPWHHIIDPATQDSSKTDILTATIVSMSAIQADIAAKVMVIEGSTAYNQSKNKSIISSMIQYVDNENIIVEHNGKLEFNK